MYTSIIIVLVLAVSYLAYRIYGSIVKSDIKALEASLEAKAELCEAKKQEAIKALDNAAKGLKEECESTFATLARVEIQDGTKEIK